MKPEYIKYLIDSVNEIFKENFGLELRRPKVSFYTHNLMAQVSSSIGLVGDYEGNITLLLEDDVALGIASKMFQDSITILDELSLSAVGELTNFISGRMITKLSNLKYDNDITPPQIFTNKMVEFDYNSSLACRIMFESDIGNIEFALVKKVKTN